MSTYAVSTPIKVDHGPIGIGAPKSAAASLGDFSGLSLPEENTNNLLLFH